MLNTYIKNKGYTKTIIHDHNKNKVNELNWDADYDGDNANVILTSTTDGKKKQFGIQLDNNDLANLLNITSINMPLHRRLHQDFIKKDRSEIFKIELPDTNDMTDILSSPALNDELIIPITINKRPSRNYTFTRRKRHVRPKTHKTYRVYKKHRRSSKLSKI